MLIAKRRKGQGVTPDELTDDDSEQQTDNSVRGTPNCLNLHSYVKCMILEIIFFSSRRPVEDI